MTPEGRVKAAIKDALKALGIHYFMPAQNGYGRHGVLDFACCVRGLYLAIEAKAPGKFADTTANQDKEILDTIAAGGVVLVTDSVDRAALRQQILECVVSGRSVYPVKSGPSARVRRSGRREAELSCAVR